MSHLIIVCSAPVITEKFNRRGIIFFIPQGVNSILKKKKVEENRQKT